MRGWGTMFFSTLSPLITVLSASGVSLSCSGENEEYDAKRERVPNLSTVHQIVFKTIQPLVLSRSAICRGCVSVASQQNADSHLKAVADTV
jgi:hypothetical protein